VNIPGGQTLHAVMLVEELGKQGLDAHLLPIDPIFPTGLKWARCLPWIRTVINQSFYLPSLLRLRKADVVQASSAAYWSFMLAPLPAMIMGRLFRKTVVLNYHSGEAADHLARWGALIHPWLKLADEIVVSSPYLQHIFSTFGYHAKIINNAVDTSRFVYRERHPLYPRFLSVRNFEWYHGLDQTVQAFAIVKKAYPDATLDIVGTGSQDRQLRKAAKTIGVTGIRFLGLIEPRDMPLIYDRADIFLNSSLIDNQPLSILEAMACGMPIVTTGVGDIPNMIHDGMSGTIIPINNPVAMAKATTELLQQPARAVLMAQHARESLIQYALPSVGLAWANLYRRLSSHIAVMEPA